MKLYEIGDASHQVIPAKSSEHSSEGVPARLLYRSGPCLPSCHTDARVTLRSPANQIHTLENLESVGSDLHEV